MAFDIGLGDGEQEVQSFFMGFFIIKKNLPSQYLGNGALWMMVDPTRGSKTLVARGLR